MSYGRTFHLFVPGFRPATLVIIPHTPAAVSYTHLDVYKRQAQQHGQDAHAESRQQIVQDLGAELHAVRVYHHGRHNDVQDVYKRQMLKAGCAEPIKTESMTNKEKQSVNKL